MRPEKLDDSTLAAWLTTHPEWKRSSPAGHPDRGAIVRDFAFKDFVSALGFVVRVGCIAERRDHHPDVELAWGRARILWSTHDAGGITRLDLELAESTDGLLP